MRMIMQMISVRSVNGLTIQNPTIFIHKHCTPTLSLKIDKKLKQITRLNSGHSLYPTRKYMLFPFIADIQQSSEISTFSSKSKC